MIEFIPDMKAVNPNSLSIAFAAIAFAVMALLLPACSTQQTDHAQLANAYFAEARYDSAAWHFQQHLANHPDDMGARLQYAEALAFERDWDAAVSSFRLVALNQAATCTQRVEADHRMATIYGQEGRPDSAIHHYYREFHQRQTCEGHKDHLGFLYATISLHYREQGNLERALQTIDSAITLGAQPNFGAIDRGTILYGLQRHGEANSAFEQALALCGTDSMCRFEGHMGRARVALAQGKQEQACSDFHAAVRWGHPAPDTALARICGHQVDAVVKE